MRLASLLVFSSSVNELRIRLITDKHVHHIRHSRNYYHKMSLYYSDYTVEKFHHFHSSGSAIPHFASSHRIAQKHKPNGKQRQPKNNTQKMRTFHIVNIPSTAHNGISGIFVRKIQYIYADLFGMWKNPIQLFRCNFGVFCQLAIGCV